MIDCFDNEFSIICIVMNLCVYCQEVFVLNIVNVDMLQYKVCDFDFVIMLGNVMVGKGGGVLQMNQILMCYIQGELGVLYNVDLKYCSEYQGVVDGNMVNMDIECVDFVENVLQFEILIIVVCMCLGDLCMVL